MTSDKEKLSRILTQFFHICQCSEEKIDKRLKKVFIEFTTTVMEVDNVEAFLVKCNCLISNIFCSWYCGKCNLSFGKSDHFFERDCVPSICPKCKTKTIMYLGEPIA